MNPRSIATIAALLTALPATSLAQTQAAPAGPPPPLPAPNPAIAAKARAEYLAWRSSNVVRSRYDDNMKPHITSEFLSQAHTGLTQAGTIQNFTLEHVRTVQNGIRVYDFVVTAAKGAVGMEMGLAPSGLIDGIYFQPLAPRTSVQPTP